MYSNGFFPDEPTAENKKNFLHKQNVLKIKKEENLCVTKKIFLLVGRENLKKKWKINSFLLQWNIKLLMQEVRMGNAMCRKFFEWR